MRNQENNNKNLGLIILKFSFIPIIIFSAFLTVFLILQPIQHNYKKHFITPYSDSVTKQTSELYVVFPYYDGHYLCAEFLQTLNEAEKEHELDYYLIDINKYPGVMEEWEIKVWPTYFVFHRKETDSTDKDARLLYKAYGNKEAKELMTEIKNVQTYGMPINELNTSKQINDANGEGIFNININKVTPNLDEDGKFAITVSITNLTDKKQTISFGDFVITHNSWENKPKTKYENLDEKETVVLGIEETQTIEIEYSSEHPYYELEITFTYKENTETKYVWIYKMWPIK